MYLLTKNTASYTYEVTNSTLTPSSKDEAKVTLTLSSKDKAKVVLTPSFRDEAYRVTNNTLNTPSFRATPSFRVKGFRSIDLLNSIISNTIIKLRSIVK